MKVSNLTDFIEYSPRTKYSDAQVMLEQFTGREFSRRDAETLWSGVIRHQKLLSRSLEREVSLRVAAVDFIENVVDEASIGRKSGSGIRAFFGFWLKRYFELKGVAFK
jgi:hypothetical protein